MSLFETVLWQGSKEKTLNTFLKEFYLLLQCNKWISPNVYYMHLNGNGMITQYFFELISKLMNAEGESVLTL